jgi:hypothetical protein
VVEPGKESFNAASGQRHAGVAGPVVKIDGVPVVPDGLPARKDHLGDISVPLVWGLRAEDPAVSALQAYIRPVEVEQSQTETVNAAGSGPADAVINCKPAFFGLDERRAKPDLRAAPDGLPSA